MNNYFVESINNIFYLRIRNILKFEFKNKVIYKNIVLKDYIFGHLLQFVLPFFLYFLQHFFFLLLQLASQFTAAQGEYKDGISDTCIILIFN